MRPFGTSNVYIPNGQDPYHKVPMLLGGLSTHSLIVDMAVHLCDSVLFPVFRLRYISHRVVQLVHCTVSVILWLFMALCTFQIGEETESGSNER